MTVTTKTPNTPKSNAHSPVLAERDALEHVYEGVYNIEGELARGAFGVVHKAKHVATGSDVAIKVYTSEVSLRVLKSLRPLAF